MFGPDLTCPWTPDSRKSLTSLEARSTTNSCGEGSATSGSTSRPGPRRNASRPTSFDRRRSTSRVSSCFPSSLLSKLDLPLTRDPDDVLIAKHPWNKPVSKLVSDSWPMKMAFHSFEDHLAVSDEYDSVWYVAPSSLPPSWYSLPFSDLTAFVLCSSSISVWDWRSKKRLSRFSNGSGSGPITSMYFINEVSEALLLTASGASQR